MRAILLLALLTTGCATLTVLEMTTPPAPSSRSQAWVVSGLQISPQAWVFDLAERDAYAPSHRLRIEHERIAELALPRSLNIAAHHTKADGTFEAQPIGVAQAYLAPGLRGSLTRLEGPPGPPPRESIRIEFDRKIPRTTQRLGRAILRALAVPFAVAIDLPIVLVLGPTLVVIFLVDPPAL